MKTNSRIFVASEKMIAGKAILNYLRAQGYNRTVSDLERNVEITSQADVADFFQNFKPEYVIFSGSASSGIVGNLNNPAGLATENLTGLCNVLDYAARWNTLKVLYLASSCVYPVNAPQPLKVESLMTGPLEPSSEAYAMAKLTGLSLARAYRVQYGLNVISAIPADVYGPEDSFDPESSHVVSALMRKVHEAKTVGYGQAVLWGSGKPVRDFIYSEDLADASLFLMEHYEEEAPINISAAQNHSILELAAAIKEIADFEGSFAHDLKKPDGAAQKTLDSQALFQKGWNPKFSLKDGLKKTYESFLMREAAAGIV